MCIFASNAQSLHPGHINIYCWLFPTHTHTHSLALALASVDMQYLGLFLRLGCLGQIRGEAITAAVASLRCLLCAIALLVEQLHEVFSKYGVIVGHQASEGCNKCDQLLPEVSEASGRRRYVAIRAQGNTHKTVHTIGCNKTKQKLATKV